MTATSSRSTRSFSSNAARYEAGIWRSLFRWVTRRPRSADPQAALFGCASEVTPILIAFIAVSALELPIVSLIVPWPTVRDLLLLLGIWGLAWMLGLLAALRVNPHAVTETGLEIRSGFQFHAHIAWDQIAQIRRRSSYSQPKLHIQRNNAGALLAIQSTTNIEITPRSPITVHFMHGGSAQVNTIRIFADAPAELIAATSNHLARIRASQE